MTGEPFSLAGDTGANYTIIATDKAGSTTEYNVTMKPIENLIESIADLTTGNVTSDDQETVKSVKKIKAVDTEEEKQALQEITDKCDKLPEKIKKVMKVIEGIETRLDDYTIQTVTPDNESELKQLKEDTEQLIDEAKKQYDALTEYEKILVNEEPREKLASLLAALGDYEIIKGDVGKQEKGIKTGLSFTANGTYSEFTGIEVDGKAIDEDNYTVVFVSTVITLKTEYLETFPVGKHTLTVQYTDGAANCADSALYNFQKE